MKILIGLGCLGLSVISYLINKSAFKGDEKPGFSTEPKNQAERQVLKTLR